MNVKGVGAVYETGISRGKGDVVNLKAKGMGLQSRRRDNAEWFQMEITQMPQHHGPIIALARDMRATTSNFLLACARRGREHWHLYPHVTLHKMQLFPPDPYSPTTCEKKLSKLSQRRWNPTYDILSGGPHLGAFITFLFCHQGDILLAIVVDIYSRGIRTNVRKR